MAVFEYKIYACEYNNIPHIRRVKPNEDAIFSWIQKGDLFYFSLGDNRYGYLYSMNNNDILLVSSGIDKMNVMLSNELIRSEDAVSFLEQFAMPVFLSLLEPSSAYVINSKYIKKWNEYKNRPRYGYSAEALSIASEVLTKYISNPKPAVDGDGWTLDFFVVFLDGRIERWSFDGYVFPFRILELHKSLVEKTGTIAPIPVVGGGISYKEEPPPEVQDQEPTGQPTHADGQRAK